MRQTSGDWKSCCESIRVDIPERLQTNKDMITLLDRFIKNLWKVKHGQKSKMVRI